MLALTLSGFGDRLRSERRRLNYSQVKFAELAGVKRATQYLYENDETVPNLKYFDAIQGLGADLSFLLFKRHSVTPERQDFISISPKLLRDIFAIVEDVGRDQEGNLLPLETRQDFFSVLCASYADREDQQINPDQVKLMLNR